MDQGNAAVVSAGLGIFGTLAAGLGTSWLQGRRSRQQLFEQEAVDVRHRLREERRTAYAAVLDRCDEVSQALDPVILARVQPDWEEDGDHKELWAPVNAALGALSRAATTVMITGPGSMAEFATALHDATMEKANSMRMPGWPLDRRTVTYAAGVTQVEELRARFVDTAREVLGSPTL